MTDIETSCRFFEIKLASRMVFVYGNPPFYGQVKRGGAALNLRSVDRSPIDVDAREREELLSASITVKGADDLARLETEFRSTGVSFRQPLTRRPWGAMNFIIKDPDGNLLLFAAPAE